MPGYVYKGTQLDAHLPITEPLLQPVPRLRQICGTRSGYNAHYRNKEKACDDCRAANSKYSYEYSHRGK